MKRILVIDDEENILILCKYILDKKGYNVTTTGTKTDAESELASTDFDLIILDCTLGFYIGENFVDEIRMKYSDTGLIVMSGYFSSDEIEECMRKGVYCCMDKPFKHHELLDKVTDYFERTTNNIKGIIGIPV